MDEKIDVSDLGSTFETVLRNIGLDPRIVSLPSLKTNQSDQPPVSARFVLCRLTDEEWNEIDRAAIFPLEPPQAEAMRNREVLEAVITVVGQGRAWTMLDGCGLSSEAVRKKFARLARKGVWQGLAARAETLAVSGERQAELKTIGHRAASCRR